MTNLICKEIKDAKGKNVLFCNNNTTGYFPKDYNSSKKYSNYICQKIGNEYKCRLLLPGEPVGNMIYCEKIKNFKDYIQVTNKLNAAEYILLVKFAYFHYNKTKYLLIKKDDEFLQSLLIDLDLLGITKYYGEIFHNYGLAKKGTNDAQHAILIEFGKILMKYYTPEYDKYLKDTPWQKDKFQKEKENYGVLQFFFTKALKDRCFINQDRLTKALEKVSRGSSTEEKLNEVLSKVGRIDKQIWENNEAKYDKMKKKYLNDIWLNVKPYTWYENMLLFVYFLEGKIDATPTHLGPLTLDVTETNVKNMINIVKLGFITVDSQPGICETYDNDYDGENFSGSTIQREYVDGNYPIKNYDVFIEYLKKIADTHNFAILVTKSLYDEDEENDTEAEFVLKYNIDKLKSYPDIPYDEDDEYYNSDEKHINETSLYDYKTKKWMGPTNMWVDNPHYANLMEAIYVRDLQQIKKNLTEYAYNFKITAGNYCEPGELSQCILYALIETTLDPRYRKFV